jgi:hypothetical protein
MQAHRLKAIGFLTVIDGTLNQTNREPFGRMEREKSYE